MMLAEEAPGTWGNRCALRLLCVFVYSQNVCGVSQLGAHNQKCWLYGAGWDKFVHVS